MIALKVKEWPLEIVQVFMASLTLQKDVMQLNLTGESETRGFIRLVCLGIALADVKIDDNGIQVCLLYSWEK